MENAKFNKDSPNLLIHLSFRSASVRSAIQFLCSLNFSLLSFFGFWMCTRKHTKHLDLTTTTTKKPMGENKCCLNRKILYVHEVKLLFGVCVLGCVRVCYSENSSRTLWDFDTWTNLIWWLTFTDDNSILGWEASSMCVCVGITQWHSLFSTPVSCHLPFSASKFLSDGKLVASCSVCTSLWYVLMVVSAYFPF